MSDTPTSPTADFIRQRITREVEQGEHASPVTTRFPPEPNGYLHIGHAKSVCLNFGVAQEFDGRCYMRFDDTNPERETMEYVEAILADVRWLGFDWEDRLTHASDYFQQLYDFAEALVRDGKAYVDSLSPEQIREFRGTLTEPGRESPYRDRDAEESLRLLREMRDGQHEVGKHVLRARIDMSSPNINMRDPVMYRILNRPHQMSGDRWSIYPMYDYAHCVSDALEGITHSLCTLEFEDHRPLYDWFLDQLDVPCHPAQIEFSRLSLSHTVTSKRLLNALVTQGHVQGWDDPRMPTISGLRRRGYTPDSIRDFCRRIGISKSENNVELAVLESCIREDLDRSAPRAMGVLDPLKVVIENYPEEGEEHFDAANHPARPEMGTRPVPFARELWIERADFMEDPPRRFFRLSPGREVRLRYAYYVTCTGVDRDPDTGEVTRVRCQYDPETRGGDSPDGRKVKGTLHWVSARHAVSATVRLYETLFTEADPGAARHGGDWAALLNPDSLRVLEDCKLEPSLAGAAGDDRFQFERTGYFCVDPDRDANGGPVFNRTVGLRDSWARAKGRG